MKILYEAGLVESRQEGKWTHYKISAKGRAEALALLAQATLTDPAAKQEDPACCAAL
jgi:ArsR family transcriptional regulator